MYAIITFRYTCIFFAALYLYLFVLNYYLLSHMSYLTSPKLKKKLAISLNEIKGVVGTILIRTNDFLHISNWF